MKQETTNRQKNKKKLSNAYDYFIKTICFVGIALIFLMTCSISFAMIWAILFYVDMNNMEIVTDSNFTSYYLGCISSPIIVILGHKISRKFLVSYPIEQKNQFGNRIINVWYSIIFGMGIFPARIAIYVFYFSLAFLENKLWLSDSINSVDLIFFLRANQISVILLGIADLVLGEIKKTRESLGYGCKVWLEVALLERLDIMRKSTKRRIHYLLKKERYKDIFNEFNYVTDEIDGMSLKKFVEYAKKTNLKEKENFFWCYYQAALKKATVIKKTEYNIQEKILEYLNTYFNNDLEFIYKKIVDNNLFDYCDTYFSLITKLQIYNCNMIISEYGYEIVYEILETDDIFLKINKRKNQNEKKFCVVIEKLKNIYEAL